MNAGETSGPIVVSGAGGWLGRELLENYLADFGNSWVKANLICLGSSERHIQLSDGTKVTITNYFDADLPSEITGFAHLAFLTRDKVSTHSIANYLLENSKITGRALEIIAKCSPSWVATVSSGAVFSPNTRDLECDPVDNPYGYAKRAEESLLESLCKEQGVNLSIGRLWAAGGPNMPVNKAYALSDFISSAIATRSIKVRASKLVFRRYSDASEFMEILIRSAIRNNFTRFDSGGHLIEIRDLAKLVASRFDAEVKIPELEPTNTNDNYYPDPENYLSLADAVAVSLSPLNLIIDRTINSHTRQIEQLQAVAD